MDVQSLNISWEFVGLQKFIMPLQPELVLYYRYCIVVEIWRWENLLSDIDFMKKHIPADIAKIQKFSTSGGEWGGKSYNFGTPCCEGIKEFILTHISKSSEKKLSENKVSSIPFSQILQTWMAGPLPSGGFHGGWNWKAMYLWRLWWHWGWGDSSHPPDEFWIKFEFPVWLIIFSIFMCLLVMHIL